MKKTILFISLIQAILIISMAFSFAHIIGETIPNLPEGKISSGNRLMSLYKIVVSAVFGNNLVSAAESSYTCLVSKDNSICQEYLSSECASKCNGECIPTTRNNVAQCTLGTCYNEDSGICQAKATKQECQNSGGRWLNDPNKNAPECKLGCCLLQGGNEAQFTTERGCYVEAETQGIADNLVEFKSEITEAGVCIGLAKIQEQGACVYPSTNPLEPLSDCKFGTKAQCLQSSGDFYAGVLCSNTDLRTKCEAQKSTSCVDGKDEIYWFDSCGNRENIYDANKVKSFNDGLVLSKSESCEIGSISDQLRNQATCGNCAYIEGSVCGDKNSEEKLSDSTQDFVCRDLSCVDSEGNERENGESWCVYQGAIGTEVGAGGKLRSVDTPGSRHFREVCLDGEVRTDSCADYRNEICVEAKVKKEGGGEFSTAACRLNGWQQCLAYNNDRTKNAENNKKVDNTCEQNPNCFVKEINIDKGFKFNLCAPKYPPGFDLKGNGESAENLCAMATQKCTVIYVKKLDGWKCKQNCDCEEPEFAQQMNDLCMSIGDCGAKVNFDGQLSESYKVKKSDKLGKTYLSDIAKYAEVIAGKFAGADGNLSSGFSGSIGIPDNLGNPEVANTKVAIGTMSLAGLAFTVLSKTSIGHGIAAAFGFTGGAAAKVVEVGAGVGLEGVGIGAGLGAEAAGVERTIDGALTSANVAGGLGPALQGILNVAGAIMAIYSVYSLLKQAIDLEDPIAVAVIVVAVVAYAILYQFGYQIFGLQFFPGLGLVMLAVMALFMLLGFGNTKKVVVTFECLPWQAPFGGNNCAQCGADGLPCSKYSCQSLGQTCGIINENTDEAECIDLNPNDVTSPSIKPLQGVLTDNYRYTGIGDNGFEIERDDGLNEGCVGAYEELVFGVELNEPALCRLDTERRDKFEDMEYQFGGRNLFLKNHTNIFTVPSLESLGLPGFDPEQKAEQNLYVKCKDSAGNENTRDYVINFCVRPGKDITGPAVTKRTPAIEYVAYNQTILNATIYTNEPAECKYSVQDKSYESMEFSIACENDLEDREVYGWACSPNFDLSQEKNQTFYIKCEDQPWLIEDYQDGKSALRIDEGTDPETGEISERIIILPDKRERNTNSESYKFNVKRSSSDSSISIIIS